MCETPSRTVGRPGWGWLYGVTLPPLAALAVVEAATPPTLLRIVLRSALALVALGGMAVWIRANRIAFDLQHWCACAPGTITVRVIESHRTSTLEPSARTESALPVALEDSDTALVKR
jgi:hypothetical protein